MRIFILLAILCLSLTACETAEKQDDLVLKPVNFAALPGWNNEDFRKFPEAFERSCAVVMKKPAESRMKVLSEEAKEFGKWQEICFAFKNTDPKDYRTFFEKQFTPHQVFAGSEENGLFTGYYEASLKGSKTKSDKYNIPLHARPDDLVMVQLGDFREELKGQRIAGRVKGGNLKPYETREEIITGQWPHNDKVLVWVDDPVDAFFVQIQGSGLVEMDDGSQTRIGYAGQNGHVYYAIGRELIKRGELTKETVSMQSIRDWLAKNPAQADEIMNTNKSYVFFQEINDEGPKGGQGAPLTALRSLAIDHSLIPYGLPVWVDIKEPKLQRLMMTQDTGGAIRGPVRGDVFWGHGEKAEKYAGSMKSEGQYWLLLPK